MLRLTVTQCQEINVIKLHAYGLSDDYNVQEPGTGAALDAAIVGAYTKGEPILAYYWEPTWLVGLYDLVQLEEPPYSDACNDEIQKALTKEIAVSSVSPNAGCHYEEIAVHKGVHAKLKERAPEVVAFLERMTVGTQPLNELAAFMQSEEASAEAAALQFFARYPDRWRDWVSGDVEQALVDALAKEGVNL